jgi:hypothetical protein
MQINITSEEIRFTMLLTFKKEKMAKTSCKTFKVKLTTAQLKTANSNAIDVPQHAAPCKGYTWSIGMVELRGILPEVMHLKAVPSSL